MDRKPKLILKEISRGIMLTTGIALSVFPNFIDISEFVENPYHIRGFGQIIFIIAVLWYLYDVTKKYLWEEPDIELSPYPKDFFPIGYFYKTATLEIHNNEELPITKCFATLEVANDINIDRNDSVSIFPLIPSIMPSQRIRWEEELEMDEDCGMTIMGGASRHISVGSFKNMFFYHLQEGDIQNQRNFGIPVHAVRIRIDGYFNERQMKPLFFEGYIYAANLTPPSMPKELHEEVKDRIQNLRMVFKGGDWMKDEEVKRYMGVKEYRI